MAKRAIPACILFLTCLAGPAQAELELPALFTDHMVLQRQRPVPVWGWAKAGTEVTVTLAGEKAKATAADDGRWRADLPPMGAGGPHTLTVSSGDGSVSVEDVLVGEVWLCSGQSNMEFALRSAASASEAVSAADHPKMRLYEIPRLAAEEVQRDLQKDVQWRVCRPETAKGFTAVGYFFGRRLRKALDVPIGLIQSAWGGSAAEAWTSMEALRSKPLLKPIAARAGKIGSPNRTPARLHNAMLRPLMPFAFRGAVWYQGEANVGRAYQYRSLLPTMIRNWRDLWGQGDFPFYFVQIAPFDYGDRGSLPILWESQALTHRMVPNTGVAVINDHGNPENIHPKRKRPVGERLARWALARDYGRDIVPSGPLFRSLTVEGNKAIVRFDHTADGLKTRDGEPPTHFRIAGRDRSFHAATARIEGDTVVVSADAVPHPVAVRFAWEDVASPNLVNSEGLPASAFRTDDWPAPTADKQ